MDIVIHHSADFDGLFSREIARKFLPEAKLIGWDFGDPPIEDSLLGAGNTIYVMDLPLDRPFGLEFKDGWICKAGEQVQPIDRWDSGNIVWIDHHKTSIDTHPKSIPGYRIDGVAACRLAWQWFATFNDSRNSIGLPSGIQSPLPEKPDFIDRKVSEPLAVRLAGEYDIWDRRDPRAETFQYGLRLGEPVWRVLLDQQHPDNGALVGKMLIEGETAQRYQQKIDADLVNYRSYRLEWEGLKFIVLNTGRFNSLTFAAQDRPETGHDALMGYMFNGREWVVSLYHAQHRTDLDLSAIAAKYGGGGHRGACGFRMSKLPFLP